MPCTCPPTNHLCTCGAESEREHEQASGESADAHETRCHSTGCVRCWNLEHARRSRGAKH